MGQQNMPKHSTEEKWLSLGNDSLASGLSYGRIGLAIFPLGAAQAYSIVLYANAKNHPCPE